MQQTSHRSALGASPIRPSIGTPLSRGGVPVPLGGINSRVQDTGYLLSHYARGVNGLGGINSRVQDTAYLLSHYGQPAPASTSMMPAVVRAGISGAALAGLKRGLGSANWLAQGLILSAGAEFVARMLKPVDIQEAEQELKRRELSAKLNSPFTNAGVVGHDHHVTLQPHTSKPQHFSGLGSTGATQAGVTAATTISSAAIASGSSIGSSATWLAAAGGPIGAAVAGATIALVYLFNRKRPARKVATTQIVDEVEPLLQQSLAGYLAGPRTQSSQAQALANFDAGWQFVVDNCGIPDMGEPGKWCVNDRKRGGKWDWFARYRDPIANDTAVVPDPPPNVQTKVDPSTGERIYLEGPPSVLYSGAQNLQPLLLLGALVLGAMMLMDS
jgi:hypothetical protein